MKKLSSKASLFLGGFLLMAIAHLAIQCEEYTGSGNGGEVTYDNTKVEKVADAIEDAFLSGKPDEVIELVTPAALAFYSDLITGSSTEVLKAFGEAFKTRNLELLSERYAEYKFTVGETEYTIALSLGEDGSWKIMRL
jgi:hypothetical protein